MLVVSTLLMFLLFRPQEIDEAARRRLSKRLYIPLPDEQSRLQIMRNLLAQQKSELTEEEMQELCQKTEGRLQREERCSQIDYSGWVGECMDG